ncbi:MAG: HD-GYP domain-containing protein [Candidatus Brocadiia bacterium]
MEFPDAASRTVLVVDDIDTNRLALRQFLKPHGFRVVEARDGVEALEKVAQEPPDLVLLDIMMPRLNGLEVCRRLKSDPATRLIPVVFMTALDANEDHVRALEAGADDFLNKPFNRALLGARVGSLLRMKALNDQLEQAETVLFSLARATEARDRFTERHVERVADHAVRLARCTGFPEERLDDVRHGGILHDIGKIGVPDAILNKPGPLTDEEFATMRRHPLIGYQICEPLKSLAGALPLIRHHHEKLDGSGYPDGLAGEDIPLSARIMAIADIYDALTSDRSYRKAMSHERAVEILRADAAGGQLDPELVELYVAEVLAPQPQAEPQPAAAS